MLKDMTFVLVSFFFLVFYWALPIFFFSLLSFSLTINNNKTKCGLNELELGRVPCHFLKRLWRWDGPQYATNYTQFSLPV